MLKVATYTPAIFTPIIMVNTCLNTHVVVPSFPQNSSKPFNTKILTRTKYILTNSTIKSYKTYVYCTLLLYRYTLYRVYTLFKMFVSRAYKLSARKVSLARVLHAMEICIGKIITTFSSPFNDPIQETKTIIVTIISSYEAHYLEMIIIYARNYYNMSFYLKTSFRRSEFCPT